MVVLNQTTLVAHCTREASLVGPCTTPQRRISERIYFRKKIAVGQTKNHVHVGAYPGGHDFSIMVVAIDLTAGRYISCCSPTIHRSQQIE
jgi:hypothetical protein